MSENHNPSWTEEKTAPLPVDTTGAPVITECPATGCQDIDLWTMNGAGQGCVVVICGAGHMAFIAPVPEVPCMNPDPHPGHLHAGIRNGETVQGQCFGKGTRS